MYQPRDEADFDGSNQDLPSFLKSHHKYRKFSILPRSDLGMEEQDNLKVALKPLRIKGKKCLCKIQTDKRVGRIKAKAAFTLLRMLMLRNLGQKAKPLLALA